MPVYRRKRTDGSLYETYTVDFTFRGTRIHVDTGLKSKAEANKWLNAKKRELAEDLASQRLTRRPRSLSLKQAMDRYVEERLSLSSSWKTSERYVVKKLMDEIGGHLPLHELSTATLAPLIARKLRSGLAPSTVKRELVILKAMHNHARDVWEYPGLRAIAWKKLVPKQPDVEIQIPTIGQVRDLFVNATPRLGNVIMFAVLTGLRRHEIKKLKVDMVDLNEKVIRFTGKGKKTVTLPLSSEAASVISLALTSRLSSTQPAKSSPVFDMTNFTREWNAARRKTGLQGTRFHDLRHVFATLFKANNNDPIHLMTAMRHSDVDTSLIYVHADKSSLLPSLEKVGQTLSQAFQNRSTPSLPWNEGEQPDKPTDE
jgi:integrase